MEKEKNKKQGKMPLWLKLSLMILAIIIVIVVLGIIFYWASSKAVDSDKLKLADWLVAVCSVVAIAGTLILSCITITQTARANETNEKLFKQNEKLLAQNEELQKMNDYQFKIANQDKYPLIRVLESKVLEASEKEKSDAIRMWKSKRVIKTYTKGQNVARVSLLLTDKNIQPTDVTVVGLLLKNESSAVIQKLKLCIIKIYMPLLREEIRDCNLIDRPILKDEEMGMFFEMSHLVDTFKSDKKHVQMEMILEMETITGLKFSETISFLAGDSGGLATISKIDQK